GHAGVEEPVLELPGGDEVEVGGRAGQVPVDEVPQGLRGNPRLAVDLPAAGAAAEIAHVHEARTPDGVEVLRRPGRGRAVLRVVDVPDPGATRAGVAVA